MTEAVNEERILERLLASPPALILAASDLHLNVGRNPATGMYALTENFLADQAFGRWLSHFAQGTSGSRLLVLGGDSFDFVRITPVPRSEDDYLIWADRLDRLGETDRAAQLRRLAPMSERERDASPERVVSLKERRYGLQTDDFKTIWKFHLIVRGHEPVFDALAGWVAAGSGLVLVKGNHDVELHWPLLRSAIRAELTDRASGEGASADPGRIAFADSGFGVANLYVEHGHRFEPMTAVAGPPVLEDLPSQITLPLGSFINRYFINGIERLNPFVDNIKPVTGALLTLLRRHPLEVIRLYSHGWRFVLRALKMRRNPGSLRPVVVIALALVGPPLAVLLLILRAVVPGLFDWLPTWLRVGGTIAGISLPVLLPYIVSAAREIGRFVGIRPKDRLVEGARELAQDRFPPDAGWRHRYVVLGHTHRQEVMPLAGATDGSAYVNTGTWVPIWPRDRPDLVGKVRYSFAEFRLLAGREYVAKSFVWDDQAGEPRPARMLERPGAPS